MASTITRDQQASTSVLADGLQRLQLMVPKYWYAHLILMLAVMIIGAPLFLALLIATQTNEQVFTGSLLPGDQFFYHLDIVWNRRGLGRFMLNSAFLSIIIAVGKTVISLLAGLGLVYFRFPGKWIVFGYILLTLMLPGDVTFIALFRLIADIGWGNTYAALIFPALASATSVFVFRQHFMSIPPEMSESAQLDGANPLQFLFRILIPMSWNAIGAILVIMFLASWNSYLWPLTIIRDVERQVVQVGLAQFVSIEGEAASFGPAMMGVLIASIPPVLIFIMLQEQFMSGFALTRKR
jgi:sn-glycerol 3-phosphate transport system permease protein